MEVDVASEITDALLDVTPNAVRNSFLIGEVLGRMRSAASGLIRESDEDLEPVITQPELWEMKWHFRKVGEYRLYYAEPGGRPDLLALRFHRKDVSVDAKVTALQNREMQEAADRYMAPNGWGHREPTCALCV